MQLRQTNRVRMYDAVASVLEENRSVWSSMAPFAAAFQEFKDGRQAIELASQKQQTSTLGASMDRLAARDALEDVLFLSCEALGVLAHSASDNSLLALTGVTASGLQGLNDLEMTNLANAIKEQAALRTAELATLQVSAENLQELDQAVQNFNSSKTAPRAATANRMAQTESLPQLLNDMNEILRSELDRMVNLFRRTHPEFVAAYRAARVIVDRVATRQAKPPVTPTPAHP